MSTLGVLFALTAVAAPADIELLHFSAAWCEPCRIMEPIVRRVESQGLPVRHVDIDQQPRVANRFQVTSVPCFILMRHGREVDRMSGATTYENLVQWVRPFRVTQSTSRPNVSRGQSPRSRLGVQRVTEALTALPRLIKKGSQESAAESAGSSLPEDDEQSIQRALAATVRLRIDDASGHSYGTGTIIDVHQDEALVLTCAHIFRSSGGKGRIVVDLFHPQASSSVSGRVISHDLNRDVALVSIRPGIEIKPIMVAKQRMAIHPSEEVFSIGCDRGGSPEVANGRVLAVNRYLGPANLVVSGRPVDGRSGGGLFDKKGVLIGVCNAADPEADEGLYAAAGAIHQELDQAGLGFIYRKQPESALATSNSTAEAQPAQLTSSDEQSSSQRRSSILPNSVGPGHDTEIICIVRPRNRPHEQSEVIVLDRPSHEFVSQLQREIDKKEIAQRRISRLDTRQTVRAQNR